MFLFIILQATEVLEKTLEADPGTRVVYGLIVFMLAGACVWLAVNYVRIQEKRVAEQKEHQQQLLEVANSMRDAVENMKDGMSVTNQAYGGIKDKLDELYRSIVINNQRT